MQHVNLDAFFYKPDEIVVCLLRHLVVTQF